MNSHNRSIAWCSAIIAGLSFITTASANWPQWLGPNRDGVVKDAAFSTDWSGGLSPVWKKNVGTGFASVAVVDGRLYTMGNTGREDVIYCLNAETGEEVWKHSYPCKRVNRLHEGGPSATPAVDGDRVYTLSKEGHFLCLDAATGKVHWQKDIQKETGVKVPEWGFCSSPLVEGDLVILETGATIAFNKQTGDRVWKSNGYQPGYGSPIGLDYGGKRCVAVFNATGLMLFEAKTGSPVVGYEWKTQYDVNATTPVILEKSGEVFISSGYGKGCALVKLSGKQAAPVWRNEEMRNQMNNSVLVDGYLYGIDGNAGQKTKLVCLDVASGKVMWRQDGFGAGSLIAAGKTLLILSEKGELVAADASPKGYKEIARAQALGGRCWTHPVLVNGKVYCRNAAGDLVCVDLKSK